MGARSGKHGCSALSIRLVNIRGVAPRGVGVAAASALSHGSVRVGDSMRTLKHGGTNAGRDGK